MGHAESPSLISLGLAADVSQESSSFRWGVATSCLLHALVIVLLVLLRFQSTTEEPFRAIEVALISLPEEHSPAPSKEQQASLPKASPPTPVPPKAQPKEEALPPLPTQTASERLSELLMGAVGSIVVPDQQELAPSTTPPPITDPNPQKDRSPLLGNLRLPPTAPQLSRPEPLRPAEPLKIPKSSPRPPRQPSTQETMAPPKPKEPEPPPPPPNKAEPAVRPTPALPELSSASPFKKTEKERQPKERQPNDISASKNIEQSLKQTIPAIPTPSPTSKFARKPKPLPPQREKSSRPEMSAPQLAKIHPSQHPQPQEKPSQRGKMSEMMEQLLGEVKVPTLKPPTTPPLTQEPRSSSFPSTKMETKPVQSEMDQRIAKLSIPNITPVESIKKRLQVLEEHSTSKPGSASSQPSPGKNRYLAMVEDNIDRQWVAPPLVASSPVVVLKFRISRSGEISNIRIDKSSGNGHYDSAAQRAVHAVNPLPPFPPDISDSFFEVRYRFIKD